MTILGWDMSHYDAPGIGAAVSEGYRFITHKAGGDAIDQELDDWWAGVRHLGPDVVLGAYWVQYPGNPIGRADQFLNRLDDVCPGWRDRDSFILQVDCEKWGGNASTVPDRGDIKAFCDRLVARTGGVYQPIVYAPKWVYGDSLQGLGYPLWASSYVNGSGSGAALYAKAGGDNSSRWNAYSGRIPAILQFTSSATIAGQTTCDANAFRGTLDQLKALVAPGKDHDMALDGKDANTIWAADVIPNPRQRGDATTNKTTSGYFALGDVWARVYDLRDAVANLGKTLLTAINAVAAKDSVDEVALAKALAPGVAAAVLAGLPPDRDDISQEEITAAVEAAFRGAFSGQ